MRVHTTAQGDGLRGVPVCSYTSASDGGLLEKTHTALFPINMAHAVLDLISDSSHGRQVMGSLCACDGKGSSSIKGMLYNLTVTKYPAPITESCEK